MNIKQGRDRHGQAEGTLASLSSLTLLYFDWRANWIALGICCIGSPWAFDVLDRLGHLISVVSHARHIVTGPCLIPRVIGFAYPCLDGGAHA